MKIFYPAFIRLPTEKAHGIQIMKTCEALSDVGAEITLVIPGRATAITTDPFEYYGVKENFKIVMAKTPDWVRFGRLGFVVSMMWFAEAAHARKAFWAADVIYSRDAGVLMQYILLGRKLVYEAHQAPTALSRFVARRAYRVVAITASIKEDFVRAGVHSDRIVVAHDAADVTQAAGSLSERARIVYAGSRRPGKGVETVEAAASLMPEVDVEIVSGKTPAEARAALASADVVVVPNSAKHPASARYTSPMKLFEALASGARVVASDVPAIREVVDEASVWFFTPDDAAALARTIREALADPHVEEKLTAARALAQKYSWRARAATILQSLKEGVG
mgnify:CR=1 FL=1